MSQSNDGEALKKGPAKRSTPAFVPLMLAGLFMVTGICALLILGREKARIVGQTISELDIQPLLNAETPITEEEMKDKVVVLHFWGYWLKEDCVKDLAEYVNTQRTYSKDNEVLFVNISCNSRKEESQDSLKFYTNKFMLSVDGNDLPAYYDPVEFSRVRISQLMTAGGFSYPTTLVLDGVGRVVDVWRSPLPKDALAKAIEKAKRINKAQP